MNQKYKDILKKLYVLIPLKKYLYIIARSAGISKYNVYTKLTFNGKYSIRIASKKLKIYSTGGSIENEIFWKGLGSTWESETLWIWKLLCGKSKIIFDIGANTGMYSLIAKTINPSATVIAFEPSVKTYNTLLKNCRINNYDIIAEKIALSNATGNTTFYDVFEDNQKSASLSPDKLKNFSGYRGEINEYIVKSTTLADYIKQNNISRIDLMKIDVELHEPEVIEGFGEYLLLYNPIIIVEILTDEVADKINSLFKNTNYLIYHLEGPHKMKRVEKMYVEHQKWNFLLCPKASVAEFKLTEYITG